MYCHLLKAYVALLCLQYHSCDNPKRPHILFILADDLGWNDIGYNNGVVKSPTIDDLASRGVIFTQSYALPSCAPSRASLMTGYYAHRIGFQHQIPLKNRPTGLPLHLTLLSEKLKEQGYATYIVGKWHLGSCKEAYTPNRRGFDHFYGFYSAYEDYFRHTLEHGYLDLREDFTPDRSQDGVYSTYLFSNKVIEYVKNHDKKTPMFMYFALQSVHGPIQAPQKYLDMYLHINHTGRRIKLAMVTAMDDAVAAVVEAFKEYGFWEDTLLIFMSDNGGSANFDSYGSNWPLRGSKQTLWEGGTRVVTLVHGKMLEKTGYENDQLIHIVDWYPTLVNLVGGETDPDMDGLDVWNTISKGDPSPRTEFVYNFDPMKRIPHRAIRVGDYKLIHGHAGSPNDWIPPPENGCTRDYTNRRITGHYTMLFNIRDDPTERIDLSAEMPEKVDEMMARLRELEEEAVPAIDLPSMKESSPKYFGNVYSPGWC
ncbi:arylsulfatase B-like [Ptychodera flava]|uniref:arylsulfatase B-like n=1 Tax=Ptychodera flava TaxID=63121 RepID=UPI00396AA3CA